MANRYEEDLRRDWENFSKKNKLLPNIMLLGATGCGKSSLINLVFGKNLAEVNDVSRGTDEFETFPGKNYGLGVNLIDSRGYEMENGADESFDNYFDAVSKEIEKSKKSDPLGKIHIVWFCISVAAHKVQQYDTMILRMLNKESELRGRVAVVLTKCDQDDEEGGTANIMKQVIEEEVGRGIPYFEVSTDTDLELDLDRLLTWSADQLDNEDMREAFVGSQMRNLDEKRKTAMTRVAAYAAGAAAIAANPIPLGIADAALLTPEQVVMSTHIIRIYGMENLASVSTAVIGNIVISNFGKALAGGLLKLIPGIGTWVGGAINAAVASLITMALGWAISEICYDCCKKMAKGENVDLDLAFSADSVKSLVGEYMRTHKDSVNREE